MSGQTTNEDYKEGIAWERKRWEMLSQIERECKCNNKIFHLRNRADRSENGIDYDKEFGDVG